MYPTIGHAGLVYINPTQKERAFGDYSPGRWAWELKNPRRLAAPIPCRGRQGMWDVPPEIEALVVQQAEKE
ncbi:MAG: hypothetical protein Q8R78_02410 [Candidatus Omnitrophota bacterium]|nr:hypothetical protein [Candidatus Omnitrophota bacterium]